MRIGRLVRKALCGGGFLGAILSLGCSDLPDLLDGACGNYVIDDDEDCDQHTLPTTDKKYVCAGPSEENACHYTCSSPGSVCPDGYGCGYADGVCKRASGTFIEMTDAQGFAWPTALHAGDFDSDGNGDLLVVGAADSFGHRPARALFSQGFSLRTGLSILPTELANPAVGSGDGDGKFRDIAFADFEGVGLLRSYDDQRADFTVFPSIFVHDSVHARIVMTECLPDKDGDEFVALIQKADGTANLRGIEFGQHDVSLVPVSGGEDKLIGSNSFFAAHFNKTLPCGQIVLGYRDATSVGVFAPCRSDGAGYIWNDNGTILSIALQPAAKIDRGVMGADINLDGNLDLVIGAGGRTYVAYGLGNGQFMSQKMGGLPNQAAPYELPPAAGGTQGYPLAIGDLNADGDPDYVMDKGIVLSRNSDYDFAYQNLGVPWSEAVIANLNANSLPDVAALVEGALDVHFFNNAGNGVFASATLPTQGPPSHLMHGDFDGDLLEDLVFSEAISEEGKFSDHLSFAFGSPFGSPSTPVATGEVGQLGNLVTGDIVGPTGVDPAKEIGVVVEGSGGAHDSIALLPGRASRVIFSTLPLRNGPDLHVPVSLSFGHFGDDTLDIVALGANTAPMLPPDQGRLSLFRIEAFDDEGLMVPDSSDTLSDKFISADGGKTINLRYGATVIATDLEHDGVDEALVVGAYEDSQQGTSQGAFALAEYNANTQKFTVVDAEEPFAGEVTSDSTLLAEDLDGDNFPEIILTTGTLAAPSDLLILWGDGSGRIPNLNEALEPVPFDGMGVRAVALLRTPRGKGKMLLASTLEGTYLLELSSGHSFTRTKIDSIGSARAFAVIDFDHDGVEDVAAQLEDAKMGDGLKLFRSVPK